MQEKTSLILEDGSVVQAACPVIVSASRSTDIPAFYTDWFFHRLKAGYSVWTNPFNGLKSYVSYAKTRFIVFWSKNPLPLLPYLDTLREKNIGCYIQYTLNDYEAEGLEPGVPPLERRIDTFLKLSAYLGKQAVIWRFDPLILTDCVSVELLLEKIRYIGDRLAGFTEKMVFSYADIGSYRKVTANLQKSGISYKEWTEELMVDFASRLAEMNKMRSWNFTLATCGEKIDHSRYGIIHNSCIDGKLIIRLAYRDKKLLDYLRVKILKPFGNDLFNEQFIPADAELLPDGSYFLYSHHKDTGQRRLCGCATSKDIGEYNTCPHLCEYCYANSSKHIAVENWNRHQKYRFAETITGL